MRCSIRLPNNKYLFGEARCLRSEYTKALSSLDRHTIPRTHTLAVGKSITAGSFALLYYAAPFLLRGELCWQLHCWVLLRVHDGRIC